jgi:hypothetical protein
MIALALRVYAPPQSEAMRASKQAVRLLDPLSVPAVRHAADRSDVGRAFEI